jgi:23S rRNA (cytidine1920-2'-O)/16S rRNA (cytidine1409-2'-O)-methyltransferase
VTVSPLPGPSGNVEFFLWLRKGPATIGPEEVSAAVSAASQGEADERLRT